MKITRKERRNMSYIEDTVKSRIESYVEEITGSEKVFLDEVYRLIDSKTENLMSIGSIDLEMISDQDFVESPFYRKFAEKCSDMSLSSLPVISRVYEDMQIIMDNIYSLGETMSTKMRAFDEQIKAIEINVKRSVALNSVKDEATIVESFLTKDLIDSTTASGAYASSTTTSGSSTTLSSLQDSGGGTASGYEEDSTDDDSGDEAAGTGSSTGLSGGTSGSSAGAANIQQSTGGNTSVGKNTLGIDLTGGYLTLYPVSSTKVFFQVSDVTINKPKGTISRPSNSKKTMDYLSNGYFHTRTFSPSPVFESGYESETSPISDNNLLTSYMVEYNTVAQNDQLIVSVSMSLGNEPKRIDRMVISLDPGGTDGVVSTNLILPYISKILVDGKDRTKAILDNSITIKDSTVGEQERGFSVCPPNVFPTASLNIGEAAVSQLTVEFTCDTPQVIYYPEKTLYNSAGLAFYTFNYFETLILDEYQTDEDHPDPAYMYDEDELNSLFDVKNSAMTSIIQQIKLNRYYVAIKDIELYSNVYQGSGFMVSSNLNNTDKQVASVEIYSNEDIPTGTNVKYFVSPDKSKWFEISPVNRSSKNSIPTRVVYGGIETGSRDIDIAVSSDKAYLRVEMTGDQNRTPCVKSYVARIKLR